MVMACSLCVLGGDGGIGCSQGRWDTYGWHGLGCAGVCRVHLMQSRHASPSIVPHGHVMPTMCVGFVVLMECGFDVRPHEKKCMTPGSNLGLPHATRALYHWGTCALRLDICLSIETLQHHFAQLKTGRIFVQTLAKWVVCITHGTRFL